MKATQILYYLIRKDNKNEQWQFTRYVTQYIGKGEGEAQWHRFEKNSDRARYFEISHNFPKPGRENFSLLRKTIVYYHVHKSQQLDLSQMNPVVHSHILFYKMYFNVILIPFFKFHKWSRPFRFSDQISYEFFISNMCATCPTHLKSLILSH